MIGLIWILKSYKTYHTETIERNQGDIKIEANLNIELVDIVNTPVLEFAPKGVSDKEVEDLVQYFGGGSKEGEHDFLFNSNMYIGEVEIQERQELEEIMNVSDELDLETLERELHPDINITIEEAIQQAEKVFVELGIEGFGTKSSEKAINYEDILDKGYLITFYRKIGNLLTFTQDIGFYASNPELTYVPPFYAERIKVVVTEGGIQSLVWTNMSKLSKVVADNVKLLPFDDITESLANHLMYNHVAALETNDIEKGSLKERYVIQSVEMRYSNINAYNEPSHAWAVPVWVFAVESYSSIDDSKERYRGKFYYVFNAIDGGYIALGYGEGM